jgi:membrane-bound ClpP family serine protease
MLLLLLVGIGMVLLGMFMALTATMGAGGYGPPSDLVLGLGLLVTAMGLVLSAFAATTKTQNISENQELRE